jgi:hypothetical protein
MSALPTSESDPAAASGVVVFTARGKVALDQLATVLTAHCSGTPEGIAMVLEEVLHADMADLAEALTAIAEASEHRAGPSDDAPGAEGPDVAARRRLGRRDQTPTAALAPVPSTGR